MSDVERILEAKARDIGGFTVGRVLPAIGKRFIGPFVFLDHMGPVDEDALAVRPHPHLHLATVTYLFDGAIMHRDSVGSKQLIEPGAINWMTAGTGIAHSERHPVGAGSQRMHGLQIWVGLPAKHEDTAPAFVHTPASAIPEIDERGARVRILAGSAFGKTSPVATLSPLVYLDIALAPGGEIAIDPDHPERAIYVVDGEIEIDGEAAPIAARHLAVVTAGSTPVVRARDRAARIVVIGGEPLDGPRHMWWNFVSSDKERIRAAAEDWRAGRFPKVVDDEVEFVPAPDGPVR